VDKTTYLNNCIARLEELVLQELAWQGTWKVDMVGIDLIHSKNIKGKTPEEIIDGCIKAMTEDGIIESASYVIGGLGILLTLNVKGCVHIPMEAHVKKEGIKPFMCPIANMVLDQLVEKLNFETYYVADLTIDESEKQCAVRCAIYEDDSKIGLVSDWAKTANKKS
jgi:hypothetical protein